MRGAASICHEASRLDDFARDRDGWASMLRLLLLWSLKTDGWINPDLAKTVYRSKQKPATIVHGRNYNESSVHEIGYASMHMHTHRQVYSHTKNNNRAFEWISSPCCTGWCEQWFYQEKLLTELQIPREWGWLFLMQFGIKGVLVKWNCCILFVWWLTFKS